MKGKVITILGIFVVIFAALAYILFESHIKDSSNLVAVNVVVANENIDSDTIIKDVEQANKLFTVKRIAIDDVVSGAITASSDTTVDNSLFTKIKEYFTKSDIDKSQLSQLVNLKLTRAYSKNEQILSAFVSTDITEFAADERIYAPEGLIPNASIATELHQGDYVDLWVIEQNPITKEFSSRSFYGPLKIYKLKDGESNELTGTSTSSSVNMVFKLNTEDIANISAGLKEETIKGCFVVKYGSTPTTEQLKATYLNAEDKETSDVAATPEETVVELVEEQVSEDGVDMVDTNEATTSDVEDTTSIVEE